MAENLSSEGIEYVLKHQLLGRLGCHSGNTTYIVPICYAYDGNCIYARTFEGMKINIMRDNPRVCFQVAHLENMVKWQSVICQGYFEELNTADSRSAGIEVLQNRVSGVMADKTLRASPHWPFSPDELNDVKGIIFCIHIYEKTGRFENYRY